MPDFYRYCLFALFATFLATPLSAQSKISSGDSVTREVAGQSTEKLFIELQDADYVKMDVAHPSGFRINVLKPDGSVLRAFITPDLKGSHPIAFVAEGAGQYSIAVTNSTSSAAKYEILFRQTVSVDERTRSDTTAEILSPRVEAIRQRLDSGKTTTAQIWDAIKKEGTPVVERYDTLYDLVTFFWKQQGVTKNVFVIATV